MLQHKNGRFGLAHLNETKLVKSSVGTYVDRLVINFMEWRMMNFGDDDLPKYIGYGGKSARVG